MTWMAIGMTTLMAHLWMTDAYSFAQALVLLAIAAAAAAAMYVLGYRLMRKPFKLPGRVVLITGAASKRGIGYHLAMRFLEEGCSVVLWDIDGVELKSSIALLDKLAQKPDQFVKGQVCDVASMEATTAAGQELLEYLERIGAPRVSILIMNAGVVTGKSLTEQSVEESVRTLMTNVGSSFALLKTFLPLMKARNDGLVVFVSSLMGVMGGASLAPYCASKWGVCGVEEALRLELRRDGVSGVQTLLVCPYVVDTGMFDGAFQEDTTGYSHLRSWVRFARDRIMPALDVGYVAGEIVSACKTRSVCGAHGKTMMLPWFVWPIPGILRLLPVSAAEFILDLAGGCHAMERFHGKARQRVDN